MARKKGRGWHGDRSGHSKAARLGWARRRRRKRIPRRKVYVKGSKEFKDKVRSLIKEDPFIAKQVEELEKVKHGRPSHNIYINQSEELDLQSAKNIFGERISEDDLKAYLEREKKSLGSYSLKTDTYGGKPEHVIQIKKRPEMAGTLVHELQHAINRRYRDEEGWKKMFPKDVDWEERPGERIADNKKREYKNQKRNRLPKRLVRKTDLRFMLDETQNKGNLLDERGLRNILKKHKENPDSLTYNEKQHYMAIANISKLQPWRQTIYEFDKNKVGRGYSRTGGPVKVRK